MMPTERWRLDLWHGIRSVTARRGSAAAVILVTALGVGTSAAIFGLADPYLSASLPYADASRLVVIRSQLNRDNISQPPTASAARLPSFPDIERRTELFTGVAATGDRARYRLDVGGTTRSLPAIEVTSNFFAVLGVPAPAPDVWREAGEGEAVPLVLTGAAARTIFGPGSSALGAFIRTWSGHGVRVAGALPGEFVFPTPRPTADVDAFVAFTPREAERVIVIARLRDDVPFAAVSAAFGGGSLASGRYVMTVESLDEYLTADLRPVAAGAMVAALFLLLACGANVGNLALARGTYARGEMMMRRALGAGAADLWRLLAVSYAAMTAAGVALGIAVASLLIRAVAVVLPREYAILGPPVMTARVIAFACATGLFVLAVGVVLAGLRSVPAGSLLRESRAPVPGPHGHSVRRLLLVAQSAVAMILLGAAALLARSYGELVGQETGLSSEALVVSMEMTPGRSAVLAREEMSRALERLRQLPQVTHAAAGIGSLVDDVPLMSVTSFRTPDGTAWRAMLKFISDDYFEALGSAMVAGRTLTAGDPHRIVVSESLARAAWPDQSALGQVLPGNRPGEQLEVVGVVSDFVDYALDVAPRPTLYRSLSAEQMFADAPFHYVVALRDDDGSVVPLIRREIRAASPSAAVAGISTVGERLFASVRARTFVTLVTSVFALAALAVSLTGLAAVVAFTVARRIREIAVRMALGATSTSVQRLVAREVLVAAAIGTIAGVLTSAWLSRALDSFLYGIEPADPATLAAAVAGMTLVVLFTAWWPARRAAELPPATILRAE